MSSIRVPPKATLLHSAIYDVQDAVNQIVQLIAEYRQQNPTCTRAALPTQQLRAACPDLPLGGLSQGGATWQLVKKAFEDNDYQIRYEEQPCGDVVVFE